MTKPETKTVVIKPIMSMSTAEGKGMKITLVRPPWEPKVQEKEAA